MVSLLRKFITRRSTLSVADQLVVSASNFLTGAVVGRSCTKEVFGLYVLGLSIMVLAHNLQYCLISIPYSVHGPRLQGKDLAEFTGSTLAHQGVVSALVVSMLCVVWLTTRTFDVGPSGLASLLVTLIAVLGFIMFREFARHLWFARMLMGRALLIDSTAAVIQVGCILALAHFGRLSATTAFWAMGFACFISGIGTLILGRGSYRLVSQRIGRDFLTGWSVGKWVVASSLLWTVSMSTYPWLLAFFHGTASTGVWGACLGVVALVSPVLGGIQNYLGPKTATLYAREGPCALRTFVMRANIAILSMLLPFWLTLFFGGERLAILIYGSGYAGTGAVITALGVGLVATAVGSTFSRALFAMDRAYVDLKVNVVTFVVLLLVGIPLVRAWGPLGAAIGLLTSNVLAGSIRGIVTIRLLERISLQTPAASRRESPNEIG